MSDPNGAFVTRHLLESELASRTEPEQVASEAWPATHPKKNNV